MSATQTNTGENKMSYYTKTSKAVDFGNGTFSRPIFDADKKAVKWDGAPDTVTQTIYSERLEVHSYCQIKINSRTKINWFGGKFGGVWGKRCQVRCWNPGTELDGSGDGFGNWFNAIVFDQDQKVNW